MIQNSNIEIKKLKNHIPLTAIFPYFKNKSSLVYLNSSLKERDIGQYSILAFNPFLIFSGKENSVNIRYKEKNFQEQGNILDILDKWLKKFSFSETGNKKFPFSSGAIGYFSYDLAHQVEQLPKTTIDDVSVPDIWLGFYKNYLIEDKKAKEIYITGENKNVLKNIEEEVKEIEQKLKKKNFSKIPESKITKSVKKSLKISSNFTKKNYYKALRNVKKYLNKGDIYQLNLSQRLSCNYKDSGIELFQKLGDINPAPFSAYLNCGDFEVISSSPERFLKVQDGMIETRPIKGTCKRGKNKREEEKLKQELIGSIKENAELTMIVDLQRNDLGRICKFGTVKVLRHRELKPYATVWHTVSTVVGELKENLSLVDILKNTFPGGSITGCPKIRCMEIIDKLEPTRRGVYTGSIGYLGFDGTMDLSIVIRTIILKNKKAYLQVGGGIVMDSKVESEYEETLLKAKALLEALQL